MKCGLLMDGQRSHWPEFVTKAASTSGSQCVVLALVSASPGDILEMQVLGFQCRPLESDSSGWAFKGCRADIQPSTALLAGQPTHVSVPRCPSRNAPSPCSQNTPKSSHHFLFTLSCPPPFHLYCAYHLSPSGAMDCDFQLCTFLESVLKTLGYSQLPTATLGRFQGLHMCLLLRPAPESLKYVFYLPEICRVDWRGATEGPRQSLWAELASCHLQVRAGWHLCLWWGQGHACSLKCCQGMGSAVVVGEQSLKNCAPPPPFVRNFKYFIFPL